MRLETLFDKFDQLADAPGAVAKLRELVLQFAVQGRLVSQSPGDEPADVLAVTIAEDRAAFVKKRNLARQRVLAPVEEEQCPFALPSGWQWTRLGNLCRVQAGFAFESAAFVQGNSGVPMIRIRDITKGHTQVNYVGKYREEFLVDNGDYLVGMDGNFTVAKWRGPCALLNQRVSRLQWYSRRLEPSLFAVALQHRLSELQGTKAYTTVDHLSSGQIENAVVPLPPLAEQKRIVAKVDELMALCDRLEVQQQELETRHAALVRASLAQFADAPTPANLPFLFHPSYAISPTDLRKSILTLAVQGKLIPQDRNDEPAKDCLERMGLTNTLSPDEAGDSLPSSWSRVRFEDVAATTGGVTLGRKLGDRKTISLPYLRVANVKRGEIDLGIVKEVPIAEDEIYRYALRENDLLMTEGGDWDKVGRAAIWKGQIPICLHQNHVFRSRMRSAEISPIWFERYFNSSDGRRYFESASKQTTNLASINMRQVRGCPVPFPPLTEQRRIVAKVDELMALVDQLEEQLSAAAKRSAALLDAAVNELLNPSTEIIQFPSSGAALLPDRAAIACYAIRKLADRSTFGRTAQVKVLYLAEAHLGLELGGQFFRDAAGPLDQWIYTFERQAAEQKWFGVVEKVTSDDHKKVDYRKGPNLSAKAGEAEDRLSPELRNEFDRLLALLANRPTVEVEIIATLFAAWNDSLIDGYAPSETEIIRDVRENWHPSKQRFKESELEKWLDWMRQHLLVPKGRGPHTRGSQAALRLH